VCTAAEGLGLTPIDVALAWVSAKPQVASAVIGARTAAQLRVVLNSVSAQLPDEIHEALNEVSAIERGYPDFGWNQ
jgi:aryl-alcohol dehydrogenase-like predicted oxidoreductase